jgi:hypothetical protein
MAHLRMLVVIKADTSLGEKEGKEHPQMSHYPIVVFS